MGPLDNLLAQSIMVSRVQAHLPENCGNTPQITFECTGATKNDLWCHPDEASQLTGSICRGSKD